MPAKTLLPALLLPLLLLLACSSGPDFREPVTSDTPGYARQSLPVTTASTTGQAGHAQTFATAEHAPPQWWKQFHNDALDQLVATALAASPTIASARATLAQAQQNYAATAGATSLPQVDASLNATRQRVNVGAFGITQIPSPGPFTLANATVSVSYDFDFFGAHRRTLEGLRAQVDHQRFELDAARLTLAGAVVAAVIDRASLRAQIDLSEQLAHAQSQQLAIAQKRLEAGGLSRLDVQGQRTLLAQTRAAIPALRTQLAQTEHRLATLLGRAPASAADLPDIPLDSLTLATTVPVTLPSTLARERPDIRAAQELLHQASANVGVATANLYPQFTLSGALGSQRTRIADIIKGLNIWNVGLGITQPLFHGGELRARQRAAQAAQEAALANYQQTVLEALQQVADALAAIVNSAAELAQTADAANAAQTSLSIASNNFAAGGISQFSMLDSQRRTLETALARTQSQARRLSGTAMLLQSLGGSEVP
ncbi:efflux transporter outer membrane subunit [Diaphorobacter aerolatus]|uniref:Efflux transporter outer membrane subunit n=1 Tax=Diaphorobacter aerolatus TaxID=1288495 RepID=A0A7H0GGC6_9BURK|nr:efflux transporter outer membrane subunit [Diaphorobacter aerolatus]QNP47342.1 efflux transporter outer membrane subunit [Diaphorobacter aerolatus]